MKRKLFVLSLILLLNIATACSKGTDKAAEVINENSKVVISAVEAKEISKYAEISGTLRPREETLISFEVPGKIKALNKSEGDSITKEDILAVLDAEAYEIGVEQANANVVQAGAGLKEVKKGAREQEILQAKALVEKAEAAYKNAVDNFNRVKVLYKEGAVAQSNYEATLTAVTVAEKDLTLAKQSYSLALEGATPETKERVAAAYQLASSTQQQASLSLAKTKLKAPFNGTIVSKLASEGQLVSAGMPIYRLGDIDELKVFLPVPDYEIKDWKIGDKVIVNLYEEEREGKVINIAPAASQGTGAISVEVVISNEKHDWFVGQVVLAKRKLQTKKNIFVPVEAVVSRGEAKPYVFVTSANKALKKPVVIGELSNNKYEILSGLQEGDKIVVKGADRLYDGQVIETVRGN